MDEGDELVERFEVGVSYTEDEVNRLVARSHPDFATLRRELYDRYFLDRKDDTYWRTPNVPLVGGKDSAPT